MTFTKLPSMGRSKRVQPTRECACGCKGLTKRTWVSGHDGRATGWAIRIERGLISIDDVPTFEQPGAMLMLERRAVVEVPTPKVKAKRTRKVKVETPVEMLEQVEQVA